MRMRNTLPLAMLVGGLCLLSACASTDTGITGKVQARLLADGIVKSSQIDVTSKGGVVTLTGNVDNAEMKDRALQLARDTDGVVSVVDMITARTASGTGNAPDTNRTLGETMDDTRITMSVKTQLLGDPQVKGLQIDVDTRDGVVFLTGSVGTVEERQKAIQLARDTNGVLDVQANLTLDRG